MESLQASLESEQRAKAEALRIKKKLEGDINELEIALDHSNRANSEAQKAIKRYQGQVREAETAAEEEQRVRQEVRGGRKGPIVVKKKIWEIVTELLRGNVWMRCELTAAGVREGEPGRPQGKCSVRRDGGGKVRRLRLHGKKY